MSGTTKAVLKQSGKTPSDRERLIIVTIGLARMSMHSLMINVGQGSRLQLLLGASDISLRTSSRETGLKNSKGLGVCDGVGCLPVVGLEFSTVLILVILSSKKDPKEFTSSVSLEQSGRGDVWLRCKMRFILFHNFLGLLLLLSMRSVYQLFLHLVRSELHR